jgi:ferric-dicitrate binding protein FerR (iron transport regulator)
MKQDTNTDLLAKLATGELSITERAQLAEWSLQDPNNALQVKLALRLAQPAQQLASNVVALRAQQQQSAQSSLWNWLRVPMLTGSLAAALFVGLNIRAPKPAPSGSIEQVAANDRFGPAGGFEGQGIIQSDRFVGGFEAD